MLAYTYIEHGKFGLLEKPIPVLEDARDAIVRVTLGSICTSDLHIKHGSVPRAVPGITVGHEMVGIVEQVGAEVESVKPGDRVTVHGESCGVFSFLVPGFGNPLRRQWRLGFGLPYRWRPDGICTCALCRPGTEPYSPIR